MPVEKIAGKGLLFFIVLGFVDDVDPLAGKVRQDLLAESFSKQQLLPVHDLADLRERLPGPDMVLFAGLSPQLLETPQGGDPHAVKLVEVGGVDSQEFQAFVQRRPAVARLLQHPVVEGKPAEVPFEKAFLHFDKLNRIERFI
ncbi:MAG: hypothetical protein IPJ00_19905 [Saprospirales bacterium]|nr:hypothetical protein [Saprospirales bacterium]